MPFKYEINGQMYEFDKEPTEADIDEVASSQSESPFQIPAVEVNTNESPALNPIQNVIFGLIPENKPEIRMAYLQEEFKGQNVGQDADGNITVNGDRVNPEGIDLGDFIRGVGPAMPIAGQIAGGVMGGTAGSIVPGAGTTAGAVGGGIGGAMAGQSLRLALAKAAGAPIDAGSAAMSIGGEGALAAAGEGIARGLGVAGKQLGKVPAVQQAGKTISNSVSGVYKNLINKAKGYAPTVAKFIGGSQEAENGVKIFQKYKVTGNYEDYFASDKGQRIVKNLIFGNQNVDTGSAILTQKMGVQKGTQLLAKSIEELDNSAFDDLIKTQTPQIVDETISSIKKYGVDAITDAANLSEQRAFNIASKLENEVQSQLDELGKRIDLKVAQSVREKRKLPFSVDDLGRKLDSLINETGLTGVKVPGFQRTSPGNIPGLNQLKEMRSQLGQVVNEGVDKGKFKYFGSQTSDKKTLESLTVGQAHKVMKTLDAKADSIFLNSKVPPQIKKATAQFLSEFRERYQTRLGLTEEKQAYRLFKEVVDDAKINSGNFRLRMENIVKGWRNQADDTVVRLKQVLDQMPNGSKYIDDIEKFNAGVDLKGVRIDNVMKNVESLINDPSIIREQALPTGESYLISISNAMPKNRMFYEDAQKVVAAQALKGTNPNLLRVQTAANMLGAGYLGSMIGGGPGGIIGASVAMGIQRPEAIMRAITGLERLSQGQVPKFAKGLAKIPSKTSEAGKKYGPALVSQLLRPKTDSSR